MSNDAIEVPPLRVVDLFCGAGGLSEGFAQARSESGREGFQVLFGVDHDPNCMASYRIGVLNELAESEQLRRGPCGSVVGLTAEAILQAAAVDRIDVVVGGPNCQAVSTAGRRNLDDDRNESFREYARLIEELKPTWFVMENVPGLTHANALPLLAEILERLASIDGYKVAGDVLFAADYGVAQMRFRLFVVGTVSPVGPRFPNACYFAAREPRYRTVQDAIGHLNGVAEEPVALGDLNRERISYVKPGADWREIPIRLLPERSYSVRSSDQRGAYGRLAWDQPAFTITGMAGNVTAGPFTHPEHDRPLTPAEAALLQGFPPDYVFSGSPKKQYQQIGNAVPPPLARAVAEGILAAEAGQSDATHEGALTLDVVRAAIGGSRLPVMTPRFPAPRVRGPWRRPSHAPQPGSSQAVVMDRGRLLGESKLPGNMWTAKRARAILGVLDGREPTDIATELRISVRAVERWAEEYSKAGPDGWRAYHTPLERLSNGDSGLHPRLVASVTAAREPGDFPPDGKFTKRPDVGPRLRSLIESLGGFSVNSLKSRLLEEGFDVGTVYVGDLLAIADVLLQGDARRAPAADA
jgi:DNA (cytosine-5)-methyltransferase 1